MTDAPTTEPARVAWKCTRCGYEAREFEPMTPAGWIIVTTAHSAPDQSMGTLCHDCSNQLYEWMQPPTHEHDFTEITQVGDKVRSWQCFGCDLLMKEYFEPQTIEELDELGWEHTPCGPCPRCDGKDHCDAPPDEE